MDQVQEGMGAGKLEADVGVSPGVLEKETEKQGGS